MLSDREIGSPREAGGLGGNEGGVGGSAPDPSPHHTLDEVRWRRHALAKQKWRETNREKIAEYQRAYQKEWKAKNKGRLRAYRRAAKVGEPAGTLQGLLASQRGLCKLCGGDLTEARHLDHVVPRSRGGKSCVENYQYLCPRCNLAKGALTTEEFFEHIKRILLYNGKWYE